MSNWTVEVHLLDISSGKRETLDAGSEDVEMVLKLCQMRARFEYKGVRYVGNPPWVDPIAKKLIYYCEGYKSDET